MLNLASGEVVTFKAVYMVTILERASSALCVELWPARNGPMKELRQSGRKFLYTSGHP